MYRETPIVVNEFYHIYNRGYDKKIIFKNENDYFRFLNTILRYQKEYQTITLYSYCLLPNHFHFLIKDKQTKRASTISHFMRKLQNSYAKYFNIKHERKWQLFEWRYKANLIDNEDYFLNCISYINANPIKHWIIKNINDRKFSSYWYFSKWIQFESTPVLENNFWIDLNFRQIYNKYIDKDLTPVLEW